MGVFASYCQLCALPVQHDHYVPDEASGMLRIHRGSAGDPTLVKFGPEHAWLKDAVAVRVDEDQEPAVVEGEVHDGGIDGKDGEPIEDGFVEEGFEERAALHRACWELAGRPELWLVPSSPSEEIAACREQLFEFPRFIEEGHGWMLVDPRLSSEDGRRSRERITALHEAVQELLAQNSDDE